MIKKIINVFLTLILISSLYYPCVYAQSFEMNDKVLSVNEEDLIGKVLYSDPSGLFKIVYLNNEERMNLLEKIKSKVQYIENKFKGIKIFGDAKNFVTKPNILGNPNKINENNYLLNVISLNNITTINPKNIPDSIKGVASIMFINSGSIKMCKFSNESICALGSGTAGLYQVIKKYNDTVDSLVTTASIKNEKSYILSNGIYISQSNLGGDNNIQSAFYIRPHMYDFISGAVKGGFNYAMDLIYAGVNSFVFGSALVSGVKYALGTFGRGIKKLTGKGKTLAKWLDKSVDAERAYNDALFKVKYELKEGKIFLDKGGAKKFADELIKIIKGIKDPEVKLEKIKEISDFLRYKLGNVKVLDVKVDVDGLKTALDTTTINFEKKSAFVEAKNKIDNLIKELKNNEISSLEFTLEFKKYIKDIQDSDVKSKFESLYNNYVKGFELEPLKDSSFNKIIEKIEKTNDPNEAQKLYENLINGLFNPERYYKDASGVIFGGIKLFDKDGNLLSIGNLKFIGDDGKEIIISPYGKDSLKILDGKKLPKFYSIETEINGKTVSLAKIELPDNFKGDINLEDVKDKIFEVFDLKNGKINNWNEFLKGVDLENGVKIKFLPDEEAKNIENVLSKFNEAKNIENILSKFNKENLDNAYKTIKDNIINNFNNLPGVEKETEINGIKYDKDKVISILNKLSENVKSGKLEIDSIINEIKGINENLENLQKKLNEINKSLKLGDIEKYISIYYNVKTYLDENKNLKVLLDDLKNVISDELFKHKNDIIEIYDILKKYDFNIDDLKNLHKEEYSRYNELKNGLPENIKNYIFERGFVNTERLKELYYILKDINDKEEFDKILEIANNINDNDLKTLNNLRNSLDMIGGTDVYEYLKYLNNNEKNKLENVKNILENFKDKDVGFKDVYDAYEKIESNLNLINEYSNALDKMSGKLSYGPLENAGDYVLKQILEDEYVKSQYGKIKYILKNKGKSWILDKGLKGKLTNIFMEFIRGAVISTKGGLFVSSFLLLSNSIFGSYSGVLRVNGVEFKLDKNSPDDSLIEIMPTSEIHKLGYIEGDSLKAFIETITLQNLPGSGLIEGAVNFAVNFFGPSDYVSASESAKKAYAKAYFDTVTALKNPNNLVVIHDPVSPNINSQKAITATILNTQDIALFNKNSILYYTPNNKISLTAFPMVNNNVSSITIFSHKVDPIILYDKNSFEGLPGISSYLNSYVGYSIRTNDEVLRQIPFLAVTGGIIGVFGKSAEYISKLSPYSIKESVIKEISKLVILLYATKIGLELGRGIYENSVIFDENRFLKENGISKYVGVPCEKVEQSPEFMFSIGSLHASWYTIFKAIKLALSLTSIVADFTIFASGGLSTPLVVVINFVLAGAEWMASVAEENKLKKQFIAMMVCKESDHLFIFNRNMENALDYSLNGLKSKVDELSNALGIKQQTPENVINTPQDLEKEINKKIVGEKANKLYQSYKKVADQVSLQVLSTNALINPKSLSYYKYLEILLVYLYDSVAYHKLPNDIVHFGNGEKLEFKDGKISENKKTIAKLVPIRLFDQKVGALVIPNKMVLINKLKNEDVFQINKNGKFEILNDNLKSKVVSEITLGLDKNYYVDSIKLNNFQIVNENGRLYAVANKDILSTEDMKKVNEKVKEKTDITLGDIVEGAVTGGVAGVSKNIVNKKLTEMFAKDQIKKDIESQYAVPVGSLKGVEKIIIKSNGKVLLVLENGKTYVDKLEGIILKNDGGYIDNTIYDNYMIFFPRDIANFNANDITEVKTNIKKSEELNKPVLNITTNDKKLNDVLRRFMKDGIDAIATNDTKIDFKGDKVIITNLTNGKSEEYNKVGFTKNGVVVEKDGKYYLITTYKDPIDGKIKTALVPLEAKTKEDALREANSMNPNEIENRAIWSDFLRYMWTPNGMLYQDPKTGNIQIKNDFAFPLNPQFSLYGAAMTGNGIYPSMNPFGPTPNENILKERKKFKPPLNIPTIPEGVYGVIFVGLLIVSLIIINRRMLRE